MKYRFILDENNTIVEIVAHDGSITYANSSYDMLITTIEAAKLNFQAVGIDIQPILDFEANL